VGYVVILLFFTFLLVSFAFSAIKVIRPYQRGLVERLGKYHATVEPGLRMVVPIVDRMVRVDMRETVVEVPPQEVITSDNVVVTVIAIVYYEATDPRRLIYNVANFIQAVVKLAQTNLRNVIGDLELDEALTSSLHINTKLRDILDDATDKWGTRIVRVEIQRIDPPKDVVESMHHQMRAERTRRAVVTEAEGNKQAAITNAEGDNQAVILAAEAQKRSAILEAEGRAEAIRAVALADAMATETVYAAIHNGNPTSDLIAIKYLETLAEVANGKATKIFLPTEVTALLGAFGGMKEMLEGQSSGSGRRAPVRARRPASS
jgi:regulator of protease activity HflC (stomatin/prohibitin superfamily)